MIHIVHVLTRTNVGGPSVMLVDLVDGLDPAKFRQTIIRGAATDVEGDYLATHPVTVDVITLGGLRRSIGLVREVQSFIQLTRTLRRLQPDIVHTHMAKAGVVGRLAAVFARVPVRVHTFHGHLLHGYFSTPVTAVFTAIERVLRQLTTFSLVVGAATRRDLAAVNIVRETNSAVVLPGARLITRLDSATARTQLGIPTDVVTVGFVGRFTAIKRPDRFLRLAAAIPNAQFVLFGNGPLRAVVLRQARSLPNVTVLDFTSDLALVFGALDLVVLTSDNEGVPLSLIEAAAAGLPVVAMNVGGVGEIVEDGTTGLLVNDEADLLEAVARVVADATLRQSFGARASTTVAQRCSMSDYLTTHADLYVRLTEHSR